MTTIIVLAACLLFGLLMAWLAWLTYAWIVNRRKQERMARRLMVRHQEKKALDIFRMWEIATEDFPPPVPPHPLWAVGPSQTPSAEPLPESLTVNLAAGPIPQLTTRVLRMAGISNSTDQLGPSSSGVNTDGHGSAS